MLEKFDHDFTITLCSDFLVKKVSKKREWNVAVTNLLKKLPSSSLLVNFLPPASNIRGKILKG